MGELAERTFRKEQIASTKKSSNANENTNSKRKTTRRKWFGVGRKNGLYACLFQAAGLGREGQDVAKAEGLQARRSEKYRRNETVQEGNQTQNALPQVG